MREAVNLFLIAGSILSLLALTHLFLAAWLFPSWLRAYPTNTGTGAPRGVGFALAGFAWIGACVIVTNGVEAMLWWMPGSAGFIDEDGDYRTWSGYLSAGFGLAAGTGWVWSVLRAGRREST